MTATFGLSLRRPGFTLVHLLGVLVLFACAAMILANLFVLSTRARQDAQKRDTLLHRIDSAIALLRRDVWAASDIRVDGLRVDLTNASTPTIIWRYTPGGSLSRRVGDTGPIQAWNDFPPLAFTADGSLLTLTLKSGQTTESLTLASQQALVHSPEGGRR